MSKEFVYMDYFNVQFCFAGREAKLEAVLNSYAQKETDLKDINKVLELYNTTLFFEKVKAVPTWSEDKYNHYKAIADNVIQMVKEFFEIISEDNIVAIYENCYVSFRDDFWTLLFRFKTYECISRENFSRVIQRLCVSPYKLLEYKDFVNYFDCELTELLKKPGYGARLLVNFYLSKHKEPLNIFLPKSLTSEIKCEIIKDYIDGEDVNGNMLNLIIHSPNSKEFPINDKMRYKAKKRFEKLWDNPNIHMVTQEMGVRVSFGPYLQDVFVKYEGGSIIAEYNVNWVKENLDYPTLLNNFIYLFNYTDLQMRCSFVSKHSQRGALEDTFVVDGKTMYKFGHTFSMLNELADAQMACYNDVLTKENIYIEDIVKWFFETYLKEEFGVEEFVCIIPKQTDSLLSKYERLASVMDGITKQYKLFCEEGEIDRGLYEMSSGSVRYRDIPSSIRNKYCYSNSDELNKEMYIVFSDQNALSYTEKTGVKYKSFYDLIMNENITKEDIQSYHEGVIEWLLSRGTVVLEDKIIRFNTEKLLILKQLYYHEVICLQYMRSEELKKLIIQGEIVIESTLLSRGEYKYFDYNLNKSQFTNGLDLRNKYIHDTGSLDENVQRQDYTILLKLMIILIIKINEEFCLKDQLKKGKGDFYEL